MIKLLTGSVFILLVAASILGITNQKTQPETVTLQSTHLEASSSPSAYNYIAPGRPASKVKTSELDLSQNREVYIYGVIDENNSPEIAKQILELGKDKRPINVLINSPGGSVLDGALIISAMEAASGPVNTVCVQLCASMAAMIHQYGTNRLMLNESILMFHPATGGVEGEVDKSYSRLGFLKSYIGKMENNVAKRAKMSYDAYKAKSGIEWWVDAEDSVVYGLADNIVYVRGSDARKIFIHQSNPDERYNGGRKIFKVNPSKPVIVPEKVKVMWF